MNLTEHVAPLLDDDWEQVRLVGVATIRWWIHRQIHRKYCLLVLRGAYTSTRPWVQY